MEGVAGYVLDALIVFAIVALLLLAASFVDAADMEAHAKWMAEVKQSGTLVLW